MNRILLIGNGFDLHHNLPTSYIDFIKWIIHCAYDNKKIDGLDCLIKIYLDKNVVYPPQINYDVIQEEILVHDFLKNHYKKPLIDTYYENFNLVAEIKSELLKYTISQKSPNWGDFEMCYYALLKKILRKHEETNGLETNNTIKELEFLNADLNSIKNVLKIYLHQKTSAVQASKAFEDYIISEVRTEIFTNQSFIKKLRSDNPEMFDGPLLKINNTLLLNFNYTLLLNNIAKSHNFKQIHIHGELTNIKNPMIFGYGDEMDEDYILIEKTNINEFLQNMKSFGYFYNKNYQELISFIESSPYMVDIWGHSCSLTDRTLLNMIFEHNNCISIRPYYWKKDDQNDNYIELTQNISRHFNNKAKMRLKMVNKVHCKALGT